MVSEGMSDGAAFIASDVAGAGTVAARGPAVDDGTGVLDPAEVRLHRGPTGVLRGTLPDRSYLQVSVYRAFPLSAPDEWVVLMNGDSEIGSLRDAALLDSDSVALVREELELRYQVPHVSEVVRVSEDRLEGGSWTPGLIWDLVTDRGPVRLHMPTLNEHVRPLGPGRLLLLDRDGARCEVADIAALPAASRALLMRYVWGVA